jgi:hypothetical protein
VADQPEVGPTETTLAAELLKLHRESHGEGDAVERATGRRVISFAEDPGTTA